MSDKLRCGLENKISCNLRKFLVAGSLTILSILRNYKFTDPFKMFWRHLLHSHKLSNFQLSTLCDKIISFLLKAVLINLKMYLKFSFQRTLYINLVLFLAKQQACLFPFSLDENVQKFDVVLFPTHLEIPDQNNCYEEVFLQFRFSVYKNCKYQSFLLLNCSGKKVHDLLSKSNDPFVRLVESLIF